MGRGSENDEGVAGCQEAITVARSNHLEVLGRPRAACGTSVHPETFSVPEKPSGVINTNNVLRLLEWQTYRCALTGRPLTPDTASLDHILPVRGGGAHTIDNVQVLHKEVNRAKATMTAEGFIRMCHEVVDHTTNLKLEGTDL